MSDFTYQEGTALTWAQMNENLRLMQAKYLDSANSAAIASAAANFKGNWSALTGPLAVPASVRHNGEYWMLLNDLANVATSQPGVSADWSVIGNLRKSGDTMTGSLNIGGGGNLLVTGSGGLGYGVGSGGTVTQATSKSTAVVLNKPSGRITTNNALLNLGSTVSFQLINSTIGSSDALVLGVTGGANPDAYLIRARCFAGGSVISIVNQTGSGLSDAIEIQFNLSKGATS